MSRQGIREALLERLKGVDGRTIQKTVGTITLQIDGRIIGKTMILSGGKKSLQKKGAADTGSSTSGNIRNGVENEKTGTTTDGTITKEEITSQKSGEMEMANTPGQKN